MLETGLPEPVERSSGSRVSRPISWMLFTASSSVGAWLTQPQKHAVRANLGEGNPHAPKRRRVAAPARASRDLDTRPKVTPGGLHVTPPRERDRGAGVCVVSA